MGTGKVKQAERGRGKISNKSLIFPMLELYHFSYYGFDPQIDYFPILEKGQKHKQDSFISVDALHFKLQKPISKEDSRKSNKEKKKKRWWRNAFFSKNRNGPTMQCPMTARMVSTAGIGFAGEQTESISGLTTPCWTNCHSTSGPLAGTLTSTRKGKVEIPYLSVRELNIEQQQPHHRFSTLAMPIYLVSWSLSLLIEY